MAMHYETENDLNSYLEFHYGDDYFKVPNFPSQCVKKVIEELSGELKFENALDIGCAVGRSAFELAKYFNQVDALDYSDKFIQCAVTLQRQNEISYTIPVEGELNDLKKVELTLLGLTENKNKVRFKKADACHLSLDNKNYDLVLACNLIDRLSDPSLFLNKIHECIKTDGFLVLTSPYTWLEEYTPKSAWIGGLKKEGEILWTLEGLKNILSPHFTLYKPCSDLPFIMRETKRKYHHIVAEMSIWKKI